MLNKNVVVEDFAKFTGKKVCPDLLFKKATRVRATTLSKKRLCHK